MRAQKTYLCIGKYYKEGRLYEAGETITVDADSPVSSAWQAQEEPVKQVAQAQAPIAPKPQRASDKSV